MAALSSQHTFFGLKHVLRALLLGITPGYGLYWSLEQDAGSAGWRLAGKGETCQEYCQAQSLKCYDTIFSRELAQTAFSTTGEGAQEDKRQMYQEEVKLQLNRENFECKKLTESSTRRGPLVILSSKQNKARVCAAKNDTTAKCSAKPRKTEQRLCYCSLEKGWYRAPQNCSTFCQGSGLSCNPVAFRRKVKKSKFLAPEEGFEAAFPFQSAYHELFGSRLQCDTWFGYGPNPPRVFRNNETGKNSCSGTNQFETPLCPQDLGHDFGFTVPGDTALCYCGKDSEEGVWYEIPRPLKGSCSDFCQGQNLDCDDDTFREVLSGSGFYAPSTVYAPSTEGFEEEYSDVFDGSIQCESVGYSSGPPCVRKQGYRFEACKFTTGLQSDLCMLDPGDVPDPLPLDALCYCTIQ